MMVWFRVTLRLRVVQFCDTMRVGVLAGVGAFTGVPPEGNVFVQYVHLFSKPY